MNVRSCEKKEKSVTEIAIEVAAEEFDAAVDEAYRKNRNKISVPGFRKGKAPRKLIERLYGADIFRDEAVENISPKAYSFGIDECKLRAVDYPKLLSADAGEDKSVVFVFSVPVFPEVKLGKYKGVEAVKPEAEVPESAVDSELAGTRLRNARIETATRPAIGGDSAYIDYEGSVDGVPFEGGKGENYELVLGSGSFIPGFEQQVQGMRTGEERDINVTFPKDYKAEELAGKDAVFKVKLRDLKEKILPELDDEFAKDVSEFDTLEEYKNSIREKLRLQKVSEVDAEFERAVLDKIVEGTECDMPDAMIEQYIDAAVSNYSQQLAQYGMELGMYLNMSGSTMESLRESMRPNAERQAYYSVVIDEAARLESVEVTDEEIEAAYADRAERYGAEIEDIKSGESEESVRQDLITRKTLKIITESAIALPAPPKDETPPDAGDGAEQDGAKADAPDAAAKSAGKKKPAASGGEAKPKSARKPRAAKAAPTDGAGATDKASGETDKVPGEADKASGETDKAPGEADKASGKTAKTSGEAEKASGGAAAKKTGGRSKSAAKKPAVVDTAEDKQ
ncbi:MAG: trigger factor [Oscillospiraceae bacterium]|nr:trigger factor [Oscillospiraceae bacterium]